MRPWHWTATNEVEHWAWEAFGLAFDKWMAGLMERDDDLYYADYYPDQLDAFFAAHPDDWPPHPDEPIGLHVPITDLRIEAVT